jgi:hypothetical protein
MLQERIVLRGPVHDVLFGAEFRENSPLRGNKNIFAERNNRAITSRTVVVTTTATYIFN